MKGVSIVNFGNGTELSITHREGNDGSRLWVFMFKIPPHVPPVIAGTNFPLNVEFGLNRLDCLDNRVLSWMGRIMGRTAIDNHLPEILSELQRLDQEA